MKYHFIGDQGISMRGIKKYLELQGNETSGSDIKTGGHKKSNVTSDIDIVVRSSAINPGSDGWIEVEEAKRLGKKVMKRSELLGQITRDKKLIAVSGMHGKTTVSTMAGLLLIKAGFDPTVLIGERVTEFDYDVLRMGMSDWFVAEVCEYDRSFLDIYPKIAIITNIEEEHLDTYPNGIPEIKEAFIQYLNHLPTDGTIIACADDENVKSVLNGLKTKAKIILYGKKSKDYASLNFELNIPGSHNILNALAIIALADQLEIDKKIAEEVLTNYIGPKRRFELRGNYHGADLIDDYGHHPTEISATLEALNERYPDKRKIVVFWPHQYKRIKPLLNNFSKAFEVADEVILKPIYFVPGRDEKLDIESEDLAALIRKENKEVKIYKDDQTIVEYLMKKLNGNSVLLTIGIPPVYKIIEKLLEG